MLDVSSTLAYHQIIFEFELTGNLQAYGFFMGSHFITENDTAIIHIDTISVAKELIEKPEKPAHQLENNRNLRNRVFNKGLEQKC